MIRAENICKTFRLYVSPAHRLQEIIFRRKKHRDFTALQDVSFAVGEGRTLGVIGANGAGKSTLLKILTGVVLPDAGQAHIDGRITGLLELGTGFNPEFSGLDNVYLNGTLLGISRKDIDKRLDSIVDFAELGPFVREPIKTYSSGMVMRLAFAVAIHADPQAFVVDEALSVGDAYFQQKCMRRIKDFKERGGSIIFVSHDMNAVKVLCDEVMLLDQGKVAEYGEPEDVINVYNFLLAKRTKGHNLRFCEGEAAASYGTYKVRIENVQLLDKDGAEAEVFITGQPCTAVVEAVAEEDVEEVTLGLLIRDRFGQDMFGVNNYLYGQRLDLTSGQKARAEFCFEALNIGPGKYSITVAAHRDAHHLHECYQWTDRAKSFEIVADSRNNFTGLVRLTPRLSLRVTGP